MKLYKFSVLDYSVPSLLIKNSLTKFSVEFCSYIIYKYTDSIYATPRHLIEFPKGADVVIPDDNTILEVGGGRVFLIKDNIYHLLSEKSGLLVLNTQAYIYTKQAVSSEENSLHMIQKYLRSELDEQYT